MPWPALLSGPSRPAGGQCRLQVSRLHHFEAHHGCPDPSARLAGCNVHRQAKASWPVRMGEMTFALRRLVLRIGHPPLLSGGGAARDVVILSRKRGLAPKPNGLVGRAGPSPAGRRGRFHERKKTTRGGSIARVAALAHAEISVHGASREGCGSGKATRAGVTFLYPLKPAPWELRDSCSGAPWRFDDVHLAVRRRVHARHRVGESAEHGCESVLGPGVFCSHVVGALSTRVGRELAGGGCVELEGAAFPRAD